MSKYIKIALFFIFGIAFYNCFSQNGFKKEGLVLFTDRDYCISGDTVWIKVWMPEILKEKGNVVRVQMDGLSNKLIANVVLRNQKNWSEGYIIVPDSLSTGQYFLSTFLNAQRNLPDLKTESVSLLVYNRFEEQVNQVNLVSTENRLKWNNFNGNIEIGTDKNEYRARENVQVSLNFNSSDAIENAVVKIGTIDPLSNEIEGQYKFEIQSSNPEIPDIIENDGIILSGKVVNSVGIGQDKVVVTLSIADDPPYFDYYYTGVSGEFHFYLKNAEGLARTVLQVISNSEETFFIRPEQNYMRRVIDIKMQSRILTQEQTQFISNAITGNFVNKLFNPELIVRSDTFKMPPRYPMPFYGTPTKRVVPDEYIDLPDFQEISRELLGGFQYRVKNDIISFRMVNESQNAYFTDEPLRLINGIPVFKNSLFSDLKSTDIEYVDIVQKERLFGDLRFKGILSVSLIDKTNLWMAQQPGVAQFNVNCLQPDKKPGYLSPVLPPLNQPDVRQIYYWQIIDPDKTKTIEFQLSDIKGKVEITVEGVTRDSENFKASKIIEVK